MASNSEPESGELDRRITIRLREDTVQGWRQSNGVLWKHNTVVRVIDPLIGFDRDMVIAEVIYTLNDSGMITTLVVGPPEGYEPEPADPLKGRKLKKGKKGDNFEYLLPEDWGKT